MMWEPDSTKFMYMSPSDYVAFLKQTKKEMGARNIPEDRHKIVGPGTSRPSAAAAYIEKIGKFVLKTSMTWLELDKFKTYVL